MTFTNEIYENEQRASGNTSFSDLVTNWPILTQKSLLRTYYYILKNVFLIFRHVFVIGVGVGCDHVGACGGHQYTLLCTSCMQKTVR